jgi:hypothetical protein
MKNKFSGSLCCERGLRSRHWIPAAESYPPTVNVSNDLPMHRNIQVERASYSAAGEQSPSD